MAPTSAAACILMLFALVSLAGAAPRAPPPTIIERLDISNGKLTRSSYLSFMADMDFAVNQTVEDLIKHHPVLRRQQLDKAPYEWIHVDLVANGAPLVTLAQRSDNLYVVGYKNRAGHWFAFRGEEHTIPGSTPLSYTSSYPDLFGELVGYKGLGTVPISRAQAYVYALQLANYNVGGGVADESLKAALAFYILFLAEAERFPVLRAAIGTALDAPSTRTIGEPLAIRAVNWARLSCALLAWNRNGQTTAAWYRNREAKVLRRGPLKVEFAEQALAEIQPILRGKKCTWT